MEPPETGSLESILSYTLGREHLRSALQEIRIAKCLLTERLTVHKWSRFASSDVRKSFKYVKLSENSGTDLYLLRESA